MEYLGERLRMSAHRPGVSPRRGPQRLQPAGAPRPQPPVDRASRVAALFDPSWLGLVDELMLRIGPRFRVVEPRRQSRAFVLGLLAALPRKNCWTLAPGPEWQCPSGAARSLPPIR